MITKNKMDDDNGIVCIVIVNLSGLGCLGRILEPFLLLSCFEALKSQRLRVISRLLS